MLWVHYILSIYLGKGHQMMNMDEAFPQLPVRLLKRHVTDTACHAVNANGHLPCLGTPFIGVDGDLPRASFPKPFTGKHLARGILRHGHAAL